MHGISATGLIVIPSGEEIDGRSRTGRCLPTERVKQKACSTVGKRGPGIERCAVRCARRWFGFGTLDRI